jgi:hypothetical protein
MTARYNPIRMKERNAAEQSCGVKRGGNLRVFTSAEAHAHNARPNSAAGMARPRSVGGAANMTKLLEPPPP